MLVAMDTCPTDLPLPAYKRMAAFVATPSALKVPTLLKVLEPSTPVNLNHAGALTLLQQVADQTGPPADDGDWRRDTHGLWLEYELDVCRALREVLDAHRGNWSKLGVLVLVMGLARRVWAMGAEAPTTRGLLNECRTVALDWLTALGQVLGKKQALPTTTEDDVRPLREQCKKIACVGVRTFVTAPRNETQWHQWYTLVNTLKEMAPEVATPFSHTHSPAPTDDEREAHRLLRQTEETVASLAATVPRDRIDNDQALHRMLTAFVHQRLPNSRAHPFQWTDPHATSGNIGWLRARIPAAETADVWTTVDVHVWTGDYLVDGQPVSRLPSRVTQHPDYRRLFGDVAPDVYTIERGGFRTKYPRIAGGRRWHMEFLLPGDELQGATETAEGLRVIRQVCADDDTRAYVYIPPRCLNDTQPWAYQHAHAHWYYQPPSTTTNAILEYRPWGASTHFVAHPAESPSTRDVVPVMRWTRATQRLTRGGWTLVPYRAGCVAHGLLERLDTVRHVALWTHTRGPQHLAELVRYGYTFEADDATNDARWRSRECDGFYVDTRSQALGTWVGLVNRLVLTSDTTDGASCPRRCVLVPRTTQGSTAVRGTPPHSVHTSTTLAAPDDSTPHRSLVRYDVCPTLQCLRPATPEVREAWLYLAWLHAVTAHALPDPFLGLTGTVHALDLLTQMGRPDQPYTRSEDAVLTALASVSAGRGDYPANKREMEKIKWLPDRVAAAQTSAFAARVRSPSARLPVAVRLRTRRATCRLCDRLPPSLADSSLPVVRAQNRHCRTTDDDGWHACRVDAAATHARDHGAQDGRAPRLPPTDRRRLDKPAREHEPVRSHDEPRSPPARLGQRRGPREPRRGVARTRTRPSRRRAGRGLGAAVDLSVAHAPPVGTDGEAAPGVVGLVEPTASEVCWIQSAYGRQGRISLPSRARGIGRHEGEENVGHEFV